MKILSIRFCDDNMCTRCIGENVTSVKRQATKVKQLECDTKSGSKPKSEAKVRTKCDDENYCKCRFCARTVDISVKSLEICSNCLCRLGMKNSVRFSSVSIIIIRRDIHYIILRCPSSIAVLHVIQDTHGSIGRSVHWLHSFRQRIDRTHGIWNEICQIAGTFSFRKSTMLTANEFIEIWTKKIIINHVIEETKPIKKKVVQYFVLSISSSGMCVLKPMNFRRA